MEIRLTSPEEWSKFKDLRLRALTEAPYAFTSTLQREEAFPDEEWQRAGRFNNDSYLVFVAVDADRWLGMAGVFRDETPGVVGVWGMWVQPDQRRQGLGQELLNAVLDFARRQKADRVQLSVTESNTPAFELYRRSGFVPTGHRKPLRSNPSLDEIEMELML